MNKPSELAFNYEAILLGATKDKNGYVIKLSIHPNDVPDQLVRDLIGSRYQVAMVKLDDQDRPTGKKVTEDAGAAAVKHAALLCRNPLFQEYMASVRGDFGYTEKEARDALCKECKIESRAELKTNYHALRAFEKIVEDYEASL